MPGLEALERKAHVLDSVRKKWRKPAKGRGRNRLSVNDRRKLNIFEIKADGQRFEDFLPLHRLWQDYMRNILDLSRYNSTDPNLAKMNNERLLKADFHGCLVVVRKTKCPSLLGLAGIILMETKKYGENHRKGQQNKVYTKKHAACSHFNWTVSCSPFMETSSVSVRHRGQNGNSNKKLQ